MSILINNDTKVVVQGITGSEGTFHSGQMIDWTSGLSGIDVEQEFDLTKALSP